MAMHLLLSVLIAIVGIVPSALAAETDYHGISIGPIQSLYEQQLRNPNNENIAEQIVAKRELIRQILKEDITTLIESPLLEDTSDAPAEESLNSTIEKQNAVLFTLEEIEQEAQVDLSLLKKEERDIYLNDNAIEEDEFRQTTSHAELLAQRAVLEEQMRVIGSLKTFHASRLQELQFNQRLEQYGLLITLGKYFLIILVILFVEKTIRKRFLSRITKTEYRYTTTKIFTTTVYLFTIIWIAGVTFSKNPSLLASVAIVGAGLAIALQDVVKDIVGGFVILQHQLFSRGNRISFGNVTGEVIDSGLLRTTILEIGTRPDSDAQERTGKTLSIPNALFLSQPITNHNSSSDFVRSEIKVTITFESDFEKANDILLDVVNEETDEYTKRDEFQVQRRMQLYYFRHATRGNQVYTEIAADGVQFTLRFTAPIGERRPVVSRISNKILKRFGQEDSIDLAYTTQRILAEMK